MMIIIISLSRRNFLVFSHLNLTSQCLLVVIVDAIVYEIFYINVIIVDDVVALGDESRHTLILLEQLGKLWFATLET